jgi:aminoglycoside 6'-N-acetyltransferase I
MSLTIRRVTAADAPEWVRMRRALWPDDTHDEEVRAYFAAPEPDAVVFVARRPGGGLAGFLEAGTRSVAEGCESRPVAYVEGWYVDPDVRRQRVGAALMRAAEGWARSAGFREIASDARLDNVVSHAAHRALGFAEVERIVCFRRVLGETGDRPEAG